MLRFAVAALFATVLSAPLNERPIIDQDFIDEINSHNRWVAGWNERFRNMSIGDARRFCGARLDREQTDNVPQDAMPKSPYLLSLPTEFDAREQWPGAIHPIRNQEDCGSCWAFAATECLSDRFAIQTSNSVNVVLSPQDLVSCDDHDGNDGCMGGYPIKAWDYMKNTGIVLDACYPYKSGGDDETGQCLLTGMQDCPSGSGSIQLYKAASAYPVGGVANIEAIQTEIMTHGPVEAAFKVYQDFYAYKQGVYEHLSGGFVGGHAVKVLGWGTEDGVNYWLVANSWGADWAGLQGYFKIRRGTNECNFESQMVAGLADANGA